MSLFGGSIAPALLEPPGSGGSFYSSPFVLYDGHYTYTGSGSSVAAIRFSLTNEGTLRTIPDGETDLVDIPDIPLQYFEDLPTAPVGQDFAVREKEDLGGDTYNFIGAATGVWARLNTHRQWSLAKPAAGVTVTHTSIYELAHWADTSVVLARARIQISYVRPP